MKNQATFSKQGYHHFRIMTGINISVVLSSCEKYANETLDFSYSYALYLSCKSVYMSNSSYLRSVMIKFNDISLL